MKQTIKIRCKNNKETREFPIGSTLGEIYSGFDLNMEYGPVSAKVNNKVEGLNFRVYHNKDVEYLDMTTPSGSRAYTRTLFFVLCKAVKDLFGLALVVIDIPVSNGFYCDLHLGRPVTDDDVERLRTRMKEIIDAKLPITRHECPTDEAVELFHAAGIPVGPAKAVNAGGVSVSGLEMTQNSMRLSWSFEEVDERLHNIMRNIYNAAYDASVAVGKPGNLVVGANVASFLKISAAMVAQGVV